MKRIFTFGLMLAGAFALTNCAEELIDPTTMPEETTQETVTPENEGIPFKVYATLDNSAETKTVGVKDEYGRLKTNWVAKDEIKAFYEDDTNTLNGPITLTVSDIETGEFSGFISTELKGTYNWYFVYGDTNINGNLAEVNIEGTLTQSEENAPTHIGGFNCPMWGKAEKISGSVVPRVQMTHLATLHEITIKNTTENAEEDIIVTDLGISVSSTGTWISKHGGTQQPLAGLFDVNILTGEIKAKSSNSCYEVKLNLSSPSTISDNNGTKTYYIVTAPLTIQTEPETDPDYYQLIADPTQVVDKTTYAGYDAATKATYQQAVKRQDVFTFKVNGSARAVPADRTYNMESSEVYRFTLPVYKLKRSTASDALNITSKGRLSSDQAEKVVSMENFVKQETYINGFKTPIYVVGSTTGKGVIRLKGFAKEMINALPLGFYASCWNNNPTAMTLRKINIDMPVYRERTIFGYGTIYWNELQRRQSLADAYGGFTEYVGMDLSDGLSRTLMLNSVGIDPNTITFNGLIPSNDFEKGNVVIIDEEPVYKEMSVETIEAFLKRFGEGATLNGLKDILNAEFSGDKINWTNAAISTGKAIYNTIYGIVEGKAGGLASVAMTVLKLRDYEALMYTMRDMKFEIIIETYPYDSSYSATELTTGYQPIVFWGFDAAGTVTQY